VAVNKQTFNGRSLAWGLWIYKKGKRYQVVSLGLVLVFSLLLFSLGGVKY
jgi:hypothetical protein